MTTRTAKSIAACVGFLAVSALTMLTLPAHAADVVFPTGSRIGIVPPSGMRPSRAFLGFEDVENHAMIFMNTLPPAAYAELAGAANGPHPANITVEKRETLHLEGGDGVLLSGTQVSAENEHFRKWLLVASTKELTAVVSVQVPEQDKIYTDEIVHAALVTLAERSNVPQEELLDLLPFTLGDRAGFRIVNIAPGRGLLLVDAPEHPHLVATDGLPRYDLNARFLVSAQPGGPRIPADRADFARFAFGTITGLTDIRLTMSEPVRIEGQEAFETVAQAKDAASGTEVRVVQWLRFGDGRFLQMVGITRADTWSSEMPRLRTLRDGIKLR